MRSRIRTIRCSRSKFGVATTISFKNSMNKKNRKFFEFTFTRRSSNSEPLRTFWSVSDANFHKMSNKSANFTKAADRQILTMLYNAWISSIIFLLSLKFTQKPRKQSIVHANRHQKSKEIPAPWALMNTAHCSKKWIFFKKKINKTLNLSQSNCRRS